MRPPIARIEIPFEVPSQNVTERRHWRSRAKEVRCLGYMLLAATNGKRVGHDGRKRRLEVVAYRARRIADYANLVGGCKTLLDALVKAGVLVDDSMRWVDVSYAQELHRAAGYDRPTTVISVFEVDAEGQCA